MTIKSEPSAQRRKVNHKWGLKKPILSIWSCMTNSIFYSLKYRKWRKTCKRKNKKSWEGKRKNKKKSRKRTKSAKAPKRNPKLASTPSSLKCPRKRNYTPSKRIPTRRGITYTTFHKSSEHTKTLSHSRESI
jgi:hypothetical protein